MNPEQQHKLLDTNQMRLIIAGIGQGPTEPPDHHNTLIASCTCTDCTSSNNNGNGNGNGNSGGH